MRVVIASGNRGKILEISSVLGRLGYECTGCFGHERAGGFSGRSDAKNTPFDAKNTPSNEGFLRIFEEKGSTFRENASQKAHFLGAKEGEIVLADDSGLAVDALCGAPGVYSARYGGEGLSDKQRTALLLKNMEGVPQGRRSARFVCVMCALLPDGREIFAEGVCEGYILTEPRGEGGFGYDPVFYSPELGKTFAEASEDEKNAVSHRGRALAELGKMLEQLKEKGLIK